MWGVRKTLVWPPGLRESNIKASDRLLITSGPSQIALQECSVEDVTLRNKKKDKQKQKQMDINQKSAKTQLNRTLMLRKTSLYYAHRVAKAGRDHRSTTPSHDALYCLCPSSRPLRAPPQPSFCLSHPLLPFALLAIGAAVVHQLLTVIAFWIGSL